MSFPVHRGTMGSPSLCIGSRIDSKKHSIAFTPSLTSSTGLAKLAVMQTTILERLLALRFMGMGKIRKFLRGPNPVTMVRHKTRDGILLALDPESYLEWFIIKYGYYEREILDAILQHLPVRGTFWDVGANIGLHSLTVKCLRPDASVVAFEPVPFVASRFLINQALADLEVDLFPIALSDSEGYAKISMKFVGNSGLSSLNPWPGVTYDGVANCRIDSGDRLIERDDVNAPNVIKIDVEGLEQAVLAGLRNHLSSPSLMAIIFESDGTHYEDITSMLASAGFSCTPIQPVNDDEVSKVVNFIALRS